MGQVNQLWPFLWQYVQIELDKTNLGLCVGSKNLIPLYPFLLTPYIIEAWLLLSMSFAKNYWKANSYLFELHTLSSDVFIVISLRVEFFNLSKLVWRELY